jgi:hypothetical protein
MKSKDNFYDNLIRINLKMEDFINHPNKNIDAKSNQIVKNRKLPNKPSQELLKKVKKILGLNFETEKKTEMIDLINKRLSLTNIEEKKRLYDKICTTIIKAPDLHHQYKNNFNSVDLYNKNIYKINFEYKVFDWKLKMLINLFEMTYLNFIVLIIDAKKLLEIPNSSIVIQTVSKETCETMLKLLIKNKK